MRKSNEDVQNSATGDEPTTGTAEEQIAETAAETRSAEAENTVKNHVMVAMSVGLVPLPLFDLALLTGNQIKMVHSLSGLYGQAFSKDRVKAILISVVGGSAPVLGVMGLSSGAKLIPGIGTLFGSGSVAISGGAITYAVGQVFIEHFESNGTLLDFDVKKMRARFKQELGKGQEAVAKMGKNTKPSTVSASPVADER